MSGEKQLTFRCKVCREKQLFIFNLFEEFSLNICFKRCSNICTLLKIFVIITRLNYETFIICVNNNQNQPKFNFTNSWIYSNLQHECQTRATRIQHECDTSDTSETRATQVRHECYTNYMSAKRTLHERLEYDRVKNFDFDNDTSKNISSHHYIYYMASERLQGEEQFNSKNYL